MKVRTFIGQNGQTVWTTCYDSSHEHHMMQSTHIVGDHSKRVIEVFALRVHVNASTQSQGKLLL